MAIDWKNPLTLLSQEPLIRRATAITNMVLIAILAYTFAGLTWRLLPEPDALIPPSSSQSTKTTNQTNVKKWNIARWHLFGEKAATSVQVAVVPDDIPETKLKLILRGVFAAEDPAQGSAIIAEPSRSENFYKVGSSLPGNATLKEVYNDRIILMRSNRFETLHLPKELIDDDGKSSRSKPRSSRSSSSNASRSTLASSSSAPSLRNYRDVLVNNPQKLADFIHVEPYNDGGQFVGYRLRPGKDESFFSRFGLKPGDVVTGVNGIKLDTPAKGLNVLRSLAKADELRMDIQRDGISKSFVIDLND